MVGGYVGNRMRRSRHEKVGMTGGGEVSCGGWYAKKDREGHP
jgi:hypothetical protein